MHIQLLDLLYCNTEQKTPDPIQWVRLVKKQCCEQSCNSKAGHLALRIANVYLPTTIIVYGRARISYIIYNIHISAICRYSTKMYIVEFENSKWICASFSVNPNKSPYSRDISTSFELQCNALCDVQQRTEQPYPYMWIVFQTRLTEISLRFCEFQYSVWLKMSIYIPTTT